MAGEDMADDKPASEPRSASPEPVDSPETVEDPSPVDARPPQGGPVDARPPQGGPVTAALPISLQALAAVAAVWSILANLAVFYLVQNSPDLLWGTEPSPWEEAAAYFIAFVHLVFAAAQMVALLLRNASRIQFTTILRVGALLFTTFVSYDLVIGINVSPFLVVSLIVNVVVLVMIQQALPPTRRIGFLARS